MSDKTQKTAIITGASRGIGANLARKLAADGFAVVVNYNSSADAAETLVSEIKASGGTAIAIAADIGAPDGIPHLFDAAKAEFGGVDVLVNNAGTMSCSSIADTDDDAFEKQVAINLGGVFRGMRSAANQLRDGGRIISFSSSVVGLYQPTYGVYAATKAAVEALTHILAKELGPRGITVNAVAPGPVATDFFLKGKSDELIENIIAMNPFKRLGQPDDITNVVSFLASEQGGWISGQTIRANGGVV
ncbi:SDR family oxidoreductase [Thalassospira sp. ER-Se-21-Dark]|uniref:SDR family oxidoreductase n=1 Tax=Thalassospira sp. ER-Se-21-Dark TaxID=2585190 RepID=UPI001B306D02|nr:SDR family oxidoreductase [Thalassospira sp. ER-Se-21-Dark]MBP3127686.1 SDR family oxidoreductase [Thalassospira sp. ER-Se-21-Dark]